MDEPFDEVEYYQFWGFLLFMAVSTLITTIYAIGLIMMFVSLVGIAWTISHYHL